MDDFTNKKLNNLIDSIYFASDVQRHWKIVLDDLCKLFPSGKATITYADIESLTVLSDSNYKPYTIASGFESKYLDLYMEYYRHMDIRLKLEKQINSRGLHKNSVFGFKRMGSYMSKEKIKASRFYWEWEYVQNIEDRLVLKLFQYGDYQSTLSIFIQDKGFKRNKTLKFLNRLAGHLQRSASWSLLKTPKLMAVMKEHTLSRCLSKNYGLTEEEARVAMAYSKSGDREQVCEILGKSINTLKTHQKNIYKKMGLSNGYRKRQSLTDTIADIESRIV